MQNDLIRRDLSLNWHPYTRMKDCERLPPIPIEKAEGLKLYDFDGKSYYDIISSWWCNVHGHCHPAITEAVKKGLDKLDHILFAGFTHASAVELSEKLIQILPPGLERVFYSDNGSTAVEAALKMSIQFWARKGQNKKVRFMSLDRGYHGDTVGAMSVSGLSVFNDMFRPVMFDTFRAPSPYCYRCPETGPAGGGKTCSGHCLEKAENILKDNSDEIAAVIVEPMLMGAGGMITYPANYLKKLRELAAKYEVLFIADEVATGFGRTGRMFACEHADIVPDIICLSKGITSGFLPLGATVVTAEIYDTFYGEPSESSTFYHGHTYTANPIACSAAVKSIELFSEENSLSRAAMINVMLDSFLDLAKAFPFIGDVRSIGTVGAAEIVSDKQTKQPFPDTRKVSMGIYEHALEEGLIMRPLGNVIYFFLPLSSKKEELEDIFSRAARVLAAVSG